MNDPDALPPPLVGCLYCHTEGTITEVAARQVLGLGSAYPRLVCNHCHSVALFDHDPDSSGWRICYRKHNRHETYYFAAQMLGQAGWLDEDSALDISTRAYVQRQRVRQAQDSDLSWLRPLQLASTPSAVAPHEQVYLHFERVGLRAKSTEGQDDELDTGALYITRRKLHFIGRGREWSYDYHNLTNVEFSGQVWRAHLDTHEQPRYLQCEPQDSEFDPQLAAAVIRALWQQAT